MIVQALYHPELPPPPPPAYYSVPRATSFNFPESIADFLETINVQPNTLCKIDTIRDFDTECWEEKFRDAGLSDENAETLYQLMLATLAPEQQYVLGIAPHNNSRPKNTSNGSEISISGE